jgi:hypothetical protein
MRRQGRDQPTHINVLVISVIIKTSVTHCIIFSAFAGEAQNLKRLTCLRLHLEHNELPLCSLQSLRKRMHDQRYRGSNRDESATVMNRTTFSSSFLFLTFWTLSLYCSVSFIRLAKACSGVSSRVALGMSTKRRDTKLCLDEEADLML